jgi:hypothetical protein
MDFHVPPSWDGGGGRYQVRSATLLEALGVVPHWVSVHLSNIYAIEPHGFIQFATNMTTPAQNHSYIRIIKNTFLHAQLFTNACTQVIERK